MFRLEERSNLELGGSWVLMLWLNTLPSKLFIGITGKGWRGLSNLDVLKYSRKCSEMSSIELCTICFPLQPL
jgi:hypothetical protein